VDFELAYLVAGALLVGMAMSGSVVGRLPVSPAMVYLGAGVCLGPAVLGVVVLHPIDDARLVERVAELVILISLLTAGLKLRTPLRHRRWVAPVLLASVAMALTAGGVALVGALVLGLPVGAAILLGAILAPTDPVLASDVQTADPWDRDRLRFTLTGEAGLNDGAAFPLVLLGLGVLGANELGPFGLHWLAADVLWAVPAGIACGALLGVGVGRLVLHLRQRHREALGRDELLMLGLLALTYGTAELIGAYGFLAVFAAGVALRRVEWRASGEQDDPDADADSDVDRDGVDDVVDDAPPAERVAAQAADPDAAVRPETAPAQMAHLVLRFSEQVERVAEAVVVGLVGILLLALPVPAAAFWLAPLLFVVIRPAAVLLTLAPLRPRRREALLAAWFGIRGVGSVYYLAFAIVSGVLSPDDTAEVAGLVLAVVAASIVVHGVSVTPLMRRRDRQQVREDGPVAART
jgi:NhaP-type Na+/H+ or K+/H+ antiporter